MTFLEGAFLVGILAAGIPIVIHLLNRRKAPPVRFPNLRFLKEVQARTARRSRVTEWLILALRVAALLLLAFALARPVLHKGLLGNGSASRVFVVDNSMSAGVDVGGMDTLDLYRLITRKLLLRSKPADRGAVIPLHAPPDYAAALTESRHHLERVVDTISGTHRTTPLVDAIGRATRLLEDDKNPVRVIYVLTDLQASAFQNKTELAEIPDGVGLFILRPRLEKTPNVTFSTFDVQGSGSGRAEVHARLRCYGSGESVVRVALIVDDKQVEERAVRVPSQRERGVRLPVPDLPPGLHRGELRIKDDLLAADNSLHFGLTPAEPLRVLVVRDAAVASGSTDPAFYVSRALAAGSSGEDAFRVQLTTTEGFGSAELSPFQAIFLLGARDLDAAVGRRLGEFVLAGGGVLFSSGPLQAEDALLSLATEDGPLAPVTLGPIVRANRAPFRLQSWEENHPLWAPLIFASPPLRPEVPLFLAYRKVEPIEQAQVIAEFTGGDPALVVRSAGLGKMVFFASSLSSDWGNLPLRFLFAPLVHSAARFLATGSHRTDEHTVGTPLVLRYPRRLGLIEAIVESGDGELNWLRASGASKEAPLTPPAGDAPGEGGSPHGDFTFRLDTPEEPGLLLITETYEHGRATRLITLRPDARESDLAPLPREELELIFPQAEIVEFQSEDDALRAATLLTVGSELKSVLLWILLFVLLLEPFLSNRSAWRKPREGEPIRGRRNGPTTPGREAAP